MTGILGVTKAAKNLNKKIGKVPKSCRANTMDLSKAQAIMGFSSTRWLDKSAGFNPKDELDKAHFEKMMDIMKKKKNYVPPKVSNGILFVTFCSFFPCSLTVFHRGRQQKSGGRQ